MSPTPPMPPPAMTAVKTSVVRGCVVNDPVAVLAVITSACEKGEGVLVGPIIPPLAMVYITSLRVV
jgi:hypothetical protein